MSKLTPSLKDEVAAAKAYNKLAKRLQKKKDKLTIMKIRRDEIRHAKLLRSMKRRGI